MKILFQNRPKNSWQGGDYIQMEATAEALRKLGCLVDISQEPVVSPEVIKQYDLVHLWNFSMQWTKYQLWVARKHKIPVVCSMIYSETDNYIAYDLQQIMLNELEHAFFLTQGEFNRASRHLDTTKLKYSFLENGLDDHWKVKSHSRIAMEDFVLTVGRIELSKGHLAVALVCRKMKKPYVCIGEAKDEEYTKELLKLGVIIKEKMTAEELKPWYASAKVYVLASQSEIMPLTIMEAMSQGTRCVLTDMCEWELPIDRCTFDDPKSIEIAIKLAWKDKDFSIQSKSWLEVATDIKSVYESILNRCP